MNTQQRMAFMVSVFTAIFNSKTNNTDITQVMLNHPSIVNGPAKGRWFKGGALRGFDITLNTGEKVVTLRCIEQNPTLTSQYAVQARGGSSIMWVIQIIGDGKDNWLGRMQDSEWIASQEKATTPVVQQVVQQVDSRIAAATDTNYTPDQTEFHEYEEPVHLDDLPDIPEMADIPESVLMQMAEDEDDPNQH